MNHGFSLLRFLTIYKVRNGLVVTDPDLCYIYLLFLPILSTLHLSLLTSSPSTPSQLPWFSSAFCILTPHLCLPVLFSLLGASNLPGREWRPHSLSLKHSIPVPPTAHNGSSSPLRGGARGEKSRVRPLCAELHCYCKRRQLKWRAEVEKDLLKRRVHRSCSKA